jgi:hypothetical protein
MAVLCHSISYEITTSVPPLRRQTKFIVTIYCSEFVPLFLHFYTLISFMILIFGDRKQNTCTVLAKIREYNGNSPLAPSDPYTPMGRTAQLTSRRCILNTYSTNIRTEYFKRAA